LVPLNPPTSFLSLAGLSRLSLSPIVTMALPVEPTNTHITHIAAPKQRLSDFHGALALPLDPSLLYCYTTYGNASLTCAAPSAQLAAFYRNGQFADCAKQKENFRRCREIVNAPSEDRPRLLAAERAKVHADRIAKYGTVWRLRSTADDDDDETRRPS